MNQKSLNRILLDVSKMSETGMYVDQRKLARSHNHTHTHTHTNTHTHTLLYVVFATLP